MALAFSTVGWEVQEDQGHATPATPADLNSRVMEVDDDFFTPET